MGRRLSPLSRQHIVNSIAALAKKQGRTPTVLDFVKHTGITRRLIDHHFSRWNQALAAADLAPNVDRNITDDQLLDAWGLTARALGRCPLLCEYLARGTWTRTTFSRRFQSWTGVGRAFYKRSAHDPQWSDVISLIRAREAQGKRPWLIAPDYRPEPRPELPPTSEITYGEPIDFTLLRNAPVNESGVIFLFGCLASRLGYIVEAIQSQFPDCDAKQRTPDGRLRRVRIEFEYESRNFLLHGHDPAACDIIVCWRHNWPDCPLHVIELATELQILQSSTAA